HLEVRNNGVAIYNDSTITDTLRAVGTLPPASALVWRVRAKNVSGWGAWSDGRICNTLPFPSRVMLVSPSNTEQLRINTAVLRWQRSTPVVDRYRVQLYNAVGTVIADSVLADTLLSFKLLPSTSHTWRVMAQNASGWGEWSPIWQFKTVPYPQTPQMLAPTNALVTSQDSVVLSWRQSTPEITAYQIEVKLDTTTLVVESLITDTNLTLRMLKPLAWHTWRVRAQNVSGWSAWSSRWSFRYLPIPTTVELTLPADTARLHVDSVRLSWLKATAEVTSYHLEVTLGDSVVYGDTSLITLTKAITGLVKDNIYTWRVRAKNQSGWGSWSNVRGFRTYKQDPTSVHEESAWAPLVVAPQPAVDELTISGIDPEATVIRLYDLAGSVVLEQSMSVATTSATLDISTLTKGAYLVTAGRSRAYVIVR
ncbi:MAG: fibronectin type III domain-containing protein, partial [Ignavibacteria bacterium]